MAVDGWLQGGDEQMGRWVSERADFFCCDSQGLSPCRSACGSRFREESDIHTLGHTGHTLDLGHQI